MTSNPTILVTGGTGKTGKRIVEVLRRLGYSVRAASRSTEPRFDWDDQATWVDALRDVDAVYVVAASLSSSSLVDQMRAFGKTAKAQGVSTAVMASVPLDDSERSDVVKAAEQALRDAGLDLTVLRFRWFQQTFSEDFLRTDVMAGKIRLPAGNGGEAFVSADDIAEVAATALTNNAHAGRDYELTGPRVLTFDAIAAELSQGLGRSVTYEPLDVNEYLDDQEASDPKEGRETIAGLCQAVSEGHLESTTDDVQIVLGRSAEDFRDFVHRAVSDGAWTGAK
ncbi:NAD-dependent epimerase/dehydratase family protein [Nocardioides glacieisoli]|uniref:NAD-dependent epimerase/dehydratase family protein n=1 Tax=Nocardioides glacieisoli TaxID=1168730 RepID=A0A4Q2RMC8_9ACTN|nr:NmrA family NAD(P)-binding protein [Nocardioides glacieisoli]RYB89897.1 NAD-dependent epimerase/dehydratase family protein [Nocardioides glacieisoli]